jgi:hypothetical protein
MTPNARLKIQIEPAADSIALRYAVQNTGTSLFYVVDAIPGQDETGKLIVKGPHVDTTFESPDICAVFVRLWPLDPTASTAAPPTAFGHRVMPNAVHSGTILLPAPVRTNRPRWNGPEKRSECNRLRFELGLVPESADLRVGEMDIDGKKLYSLSVAAWRTQVVISALEERLRIPVIVPA